MQSNEPVLRPTASSVTLGASSSAAGSTVALLRRNELWGDLLGFAFTVAVAFYQSWNTTDLAWGLWLCSLVLGGIYLFIIQFTGAGKLGYRVLHLSFFNFVWAGFTFAHFVVFHILHGIALNTFFPLVSVRSIDSLIEVGQLFFTSALTLYWPVLLSSGISRISLYADAFQTIPNQANTNLLIYKNVIRMHFFIVLSGMIAWWDAAPRVTLYLLLFFFFFPVEKVWRVLFRK
jgi:hypothetical protein